MMNSGDGTEPLLSDLLPYPLDFIAGRRENDITAIRFVHAVIATRINRGSSEQHAARTGGRVLGQLRDCSESHMSTSTQIRTVHFRASVKSTAAPKSLLPRS
jgi:hypothetical protein